jgi:hypothetical protein
MNGKIRTTDSHVEIIRCVEHQATLDFWCGLGLLKLGANFYERTSSMCENVSCSL